MKMLARLLKTLGLTAPVPVRVDARPRCPRCGRVLLRFDNAYLCSNCRTAVDTVSRSTGRGQVRPSFG